MQQQRHGSSPLHENEEHGAFVRPAAGDVRCPHHAQLPPASPPVHRSAGGSRSAAKLQQRSLEYLDSKQRWSRRWPAVLAKCNDFSLLCPELVDRTDEVWSFAAEALTHCVPFLVNCQSHRITQSHSGAGTGTWPAPAHCQSKLWNMWPSLTVTLTNMLINTQVFNGYAGTFVLMVSEENTQLWQ